MGGPLFYAPPSSDTCLPYSRIHGEEIYQRGYYTPWSHLNYGMSNFTEEMHMPLSPQSDNSSSDSAYYKPPYSPYSDTYYAMKTDIKPNSRFQDLKTPSEEVEEEEINVGEPEGLSETVICKWNGCDRLFDTPDDLAHHVNVTHATSNLGGQYYCCWDDCPRARRGFNARYKMLVHVRTHTKEKPHQCSVCNKKFSRAENLKIHSRSHSGERPYVCPVLGCNKAYSNSSDRFKHTRTHATDRPYICKIPGCQKRYTDPSSLRKHVKTFKHQNLIETAEPLEIKHSTSPAPSVEILNKIEPITDSRVSNHSIDTTDRISEKELYKYKPSQNETICNCSHKCLEHIEKATEFLKLGVILNNINNGNNIYDETILNSNLKSIPWKDIWNPLLTSDILKKVNDSTDYKNKISSNFDIKFKNSFNIEESMDIDVPLDLTVHK